MENKKTEVVKKEVAPKKAVKPKVEKQVAPVSHQVKAYRVSNNSSSGKKLWAYAIAIFELLGMVDGKSARKAALSSFFKSSSIVGHHIKNGNFELDSADTTRIKLSPVGRNYFLNRLNGTNAQRVSPELLQGYRDLIRYGKTECVLIPDSIKNKDVIPIEFGN